jgi:hypothetical protein
MKIDDFHKSEKNGMARVAATVTWEDCDRPKRHIYIETDVRFVDDINPNPNAFLLAAIIPAMHHGEDRILLDGKICPQLRNGLTTVLQLLRSWYGEEGHLPVSIEATQGFEPPHPRLPQRTASFMSGGVDSLATLRSNRLDFPLDHPDSIQDGFFVHGFDIGGYEKLPKNRENSNLAIASLTKFAKLAEVTLIPVHTNMRHIDDNDDLFAFESHGASLAAIVHAFSQRISTALIASSYKIGELSPWGSHPLLDPNYSSANVSIRHDGLRFSRLEKVGLIAEWDDALQTLRSCFDAFRPSNVLNCGKCEKCLRTMTTLLVNDKLRQCTSYPQDDVLPEMLTSLKTVIPTPPPKDHRQMLETAYVMITTGNHYYWRQLISPLKKNGRHDLVQIIEDILAEFENNRMRMRRKDAIKRFDRKYLGGHLLKLNRLIKSGSLNP